MQASQRNIVHGTDSATLADVLERILDKGLVIAGDIKVKLVDIELLTIQIRLLICSVEKAREMGIDWWSTNSYLKAATSPALSETDALASRLAALEARLPAAVAAAPASPAPRSAKRSSARVEKRSV